MKAANPLAPVSLDWRPTRSRRWPRAARIGGSTFDIWASGALDSRWLAGATLNYEIFRNLAATFEYSFATVSSNAFGASFTRNTFSLGATYKY